MRDRKAAETSGKWLGPWGRAAALAAAVVLPGCPKDEPPPCDGATMTFKVLLVAGDGPLPDDTALKVKHRGTVTEEFRLDRPFPSSDVVFCCRSTREGECVETPDAASEADSGPVAVEGVLCELWTDGAARVTVTAKGYPMLDQNLEAKSIDGCIQTKDVRLLLERGDAGP